MIESKLDRRKRQKREWYARNRESVLEQQKNSEKKKQSQRKWYVNNRDKIIEKAKRWNNTNVGARKLIIERYRKGKECQEWASAMSR